MIEEYYDKDVPIYHMSHSAALNRAKMNMNGAKYDLSYKEGVPDSARMAFFDVTMRYSLLTAPYFKDIAKDQYFAWANDKLEWKIQTFARSRGSLIAEGSHSIVFIQLIEENDVVEKLVVMRRFAWIVPPSPGEN